MNYKEFLKKCKEKDIKFITLCCQGADYRKTVPDNYEVVKTEMIGSTSIIATVVMPEAEAKAFFERVEQSFDSNGATGIASEFLIAEKLGISFEEAREKMWACVHYHITERSNGMFIV